MAALSFMRVASGLSPADEAAWAALKKIKEGAAVRVEIATMRSPEQLRMYWALISKALENQEGYATKEDLSDAALCAIGHCYRYERDGKVRERAKSISFGNLPQDEFNLIFNAVADLLARTLGVTADDLRGEAAESSLPPSIEAGTKYLGAG